VVEVIQGLPGDGCDHAGARKNARKMMGVGRGKMWGVVKF
jgi:hypothetical protein